MANSATPTAVSRRKQVYVGVPAGWELELACRELVDSFGHYGCFLVGSALERADWRDIDVRYILPDDAFAELFPKAGEHWEHDVRWLVLNTSIACWLSKRTGLPIDFQFQPQTHANEKHKGMRSALGIRIVQDVDK